ncbi:putative tricarboxylic transport membrane protein [Microlunatus sagamiharensis]|uniref:Putative tricarboxylic transport membrane protein n=1 Tax=Microlunatus sagamiharensis TaxID=546874 RepID=A0A1H2MYV6_9ACTN|nr:tripartite tricarboxylate transporter substrate binding protein [Microlunatus sagamiharensis]SDU98553.1 putative tricarboxylic transport membrane protein [Microlunatus sagamiharensis]
MGLSRRGFLAGALGTTALAATGCAGTVAKPGDLSRLRIMAPASPGGGWDTTARLLQRVIRSAGLARNVQVFNVEGAGGTIGLGQLARESDDALLMMMGLVMVGAIETNESPVGLGDVTPVARVIGEPEIVVAPAASPYASLAEFVEAWRKDPRSLPIAGGSAGGTDQVLAGLLAQAGDVDPKQINYIAYSGGGQSLAALLGNQVAAGISGVGEYGEQVLSGDLKGWAVSGERRSAQVPDVPTLTEAGFDLVVSNWRGLMTHPDISEQALADLTEIVQQAHDTPEWRDVLAKQGWDDEFQTGPDYGRFLAAEEQRVGEILREIGLV